MSCLFLSCHVSSHLISQLVSSCTIIFVFHLITSHAVLSCLVHSCHISSCPVSCRPVPVSPLHTLFHLVISSLPISSRLALCHLHLICPLSSHVMFPFMPYLVSSCPVFSHLVSSRPFSSSHLKSCSLGPPWPFMSCLVFLFFFVLPCRVLKYDVLTCHVFSHLILSSHVVLPQLVLTKFVFHLLQEPKRMPRMQSKSSCVWLGPSRFPFVVLSCIFSSCPVRSSLISPQITSNIILSSLLSLSPLVLSCVLSCFICFLLSRSVLFNTFTMRVSRKSPAVGHWGT